MYKLRSTLLGHQLDVRGLAAVSDEILASGSRDSTARIWDTSLRLDCNTSDRVCFMSPSGAFVNCVSHVNSPHLGSLVACGGKDAVIYLCEPHESFAKQGDDFGKYQLPGHLGNICSLHYDSGDLVSGSWDCTAKVWDLTLFTVKHDLVGHNAAVWDAKVVDANQGIYLTCSADRTIRKWKGSKVIACFTGHQDVVRKILVLPGGKTFASASNDCTIKIWDLETGAVQQTLSGHDSFIYDLALLSNGSLVSTAEDRSVRIWRNGSVIQAITLPCISVWCCAVFPNDDIAVGGSDKNIYLFTHDESRAATVEGAKHFNELVKLSAISEQSLDDLKKTDVPGYDRLDRPGKEEGSTIMVKSPAGVIEAHQWSGGQWVKIGDVVNSAGGSSGKQAYNGQEFDYVFDVDVEDGKPPLKLPYNANENPYVAAERFLAANDLPASYTEEVVKFINSNTSGFQMDLQPAVSSSAPYSDVYLEKPAVSKTASIFPQKTPILFKDFKAEQLANGLAKFNAAQPEESTISQALLQKAQASLSILSSKDALHLLTEVIPVILLKWAKAQRLIGFDLLRISIPRVTVADLIQSTEVAESVLSVVSHNIEDITEEDLTLFMMITKMLSNLTVSPIFSQVFLTVDDSGNVGFNDYFGEVSQNVVVAVKVFTSSLTAAAHKHFKAALSLTSSLLFNLLVFVNVNKTVLKNTQAVSALLELIDVIGEDLIRADEEAAYRLCVTYGNLVAAGVAKDEPAWYKDTQRKYKVARFQKIYDDIASLSPN